MKRKRPQIPTRVKIAVLIIQNFADVHTNELFTVADALEGRIQFDHRPPLWAREYDPETITYEPPANDPHYIDAILKKHHQTRTFGPGGEKRITTKGSDIGEFHRSKRLKEAQEDHKEFMRSKKPRPKPRWRRRWPSRPFPKVRRNEWPMKS